MTATPARSDVPDVEPAVLELAHEARRARARREIGGIDYARAVRRALREPHVSQVQLAQLLHVSQPAISELSRREVPEPLEGFSGATPYEIAQRYAAGDIDREQLVEELIRFPYLSTPETDGFDSLLVIPAGTVQDIVRAVEDGLLDDVLYEHLVESIPPPAE